MSVRENVLEQKVCDVFQEIGVDICDRDIQACHRLKDKDRIIVKFTNRKDCLRILRVKRQLKGLYPAVVDLPEGTKIFVNESLCPYYRGIWNKCKKSRDKQKVHQYYTINGLIRLWIEESGQVKVVTHMVDLQNLFPDIEIDNLQVYSLFSFLFIYLFIYFDICWWSSLCVLFLGKFCYFLSYVCTLFLFYFFCHFGFLNKRFLYYYNLSQSDWI